MNWPLHRRLLSRVASAIGRLLVGVNVRDATSGFAAFRKQALEPILPSLNPKGFKLLLEILAKCRGAVVKEVPILFVDRQHGKSKLSWSEVLPFLGLCLRLPGVRDRILGPRSNASSFPRVRTTSVSTAGTQEPKR